MIAARRLLVGIAGMGLPHGCTWSSFRFTWPLSFDPFVLLAVNIQMDINNGRVAWDVPYFGEDFAPGYDAGGACRWGIHEDFGAVGGLEAVGGDADGVGYL